MNFWLSLLLIGITGSAALAEEPPKEEKSHYLLNPQQVMLLPAPCQYLAILEKDDEAVACAIRIDPTLANVLPH